MMMQKQIAFSSNGELSSNLSPRIVMLCAVILVHDDGHSGEHSSWAAQDRREQTGTVHCDAEVGCSVGSVDYGSFV